MAAGQVQLRPPPTRPLPGKMSRSYDISSVGQRPMRWLPLWVREPPLWSMPYLRSLCKGYGRGECITGKRVREFRLLLRCQVQQAPAVTSRTSPPYCGFYSRARCKLPACLREYRLLIAAFISTSGASFQRVFENIGFLMWPLLPPQGQSSSVSSRIPAFDCDFYFHLM